MPVWPSEYRPGCGQTHRPCGPLPTGIRASRRPSFVLIAYTTALYRPDSHSTFPSAETLPMSGLPPPAMCHVFTMRRVANETTEIEPAMRLVTYRYRASRLG